jgi:AcrR family transcriptional regulator
VGSPARKSKQSYASRYTKEGLTQATLKHVLEHGIADLSLRKLASVFGTGHRTFTYHFGSKEELMDSLLEALESTHAAALRDLERDPSISPDEALLRTWDFITQPRMFAYGRLALEMFAMAFRERPGSTAIFSTFGRAWIDPLIEFSRRSGVSADRAEVDGQIALALMRGLLLELSATGDHARARSALEAFLQQRKASVELNASNGANVAKSSAVTNQRKTIPKLTKRVRGASASD